MRSDKLSKSAILIDYLTDELSFFPKSFFPDGASRFSWKNVIFRVLTDWRDRMLYSKMLQVLPNDETEDENVSQVLRNRAMMLF